ncbi:MAG: phospholipase D-like domain-containing protein, partial [Bacillota bacterium]
MPNPIRRRALRAIGGLLASLLLLAACGSSVKTQGGAVSDHLMIVEVYGAGLAEGGADQYIRLYNPNRAPFELEGWSLGDGKARALFPTGARIGPGQTFYAARSADGFARILGFPPDAIWGDGPAGGALRMSGAAGLVLRREAGAVVLRDPAGHPVDQVVWGPASGGAALGWKGEGAPAPQPGEVLDRGRDEAGWSGRAPGSYLPDSDTARDWRQGSDWVDRRVLRPGQTFFPYPTYTVRNLTAYASPDSSFAVLADLLDGARQQIDLNVYSFTNLLVAEKLAAAARRGVQVRLLMEASSLGALTDQERYVARLVHHAGGQVRWIMNQPGAGVYGRYVFNHAKYAVIDGRSLFVQSENLGRSSIPSDPTAGNRGWGVAIRDQALAGYLSRVFQADWNPNHGDIFPYQEGTPFGPPAPGFVPETEVPTGTYAHPFPPLTLTDPVRVTPVLAPDHALLESKGITGLIRSARRSILVEQMYIYAHWGLKSAVPEEHPNLFLDELIAAARRGVKVRILLADTYVDPSQPKDNAWTAAQINRIAGQERLDLQARLMRTDLTRVTKLHNKGLVIDGERVLVSSINWSLNSPLNNREVGLILDHPAIGQYYTDILMTATRNT